MSSSTVAGGPGEIARGHPLVRVVASSSIQPCRLRSPYPRPAIRRASSSSSTSRRLLVTDLARLAGRFDLHQACADRALIVVLGLGLLEHCSAIQTVPRTGASGSVSSPVIRPTRAPPRRCSPAKLYGGSGPSSAARRARRARAPARPRRALNSSTPPALDQERGVDRRVRGGVRLELARRPRAARAARSRRRVALALALHFGRDELPELDPLVIAHRLGQRRAPARAVARPPGTA